MDKMEKYKISSILSQQKVMKDDVSLNKKNICKKCDGFAMPSKAFGDAYGQPDEVGKQKIYKGAGTLVDCLKCVNCGHSWK